jgi:hypothetical protein
MRTPKPIVKNPRSVNKAEIARRVGFSREYVRLIILGIETSPKAVLLVKQALKEHSKIR